MDPREQLLQSLMRDLESIQLPERYSEAQKAEIKRGRKGQAEIDKGRAQIEENERAYQRAVEQRQQLQTQIGTLSGEIETAKRTAGADTAAAEDKAYRESWQGKAEDIGKVAGPITAGVGTGHLGARAATGVINSALGGRYENLKGIADDVRANPINFDDPVARGRGAGAVRAAQPFMPPRGMRAIPEMGARAVAYGAPAAALAYEGLQLRGPAAEGAKSPLERDLYRMGGTGMLAAGGGMAFEGGMRSVFGRTPPEVGRNVSAIHGLEEGLRNTEGRPPPPPPTPDGPPLRTPADRLISAAKAAGATGVQAKTKTSAAAYLAKNVTDANRAAVATELGVAPGGRVATTVKSLLTSRKPSMIIAPMVAAGLGYDAASGDAEAAGATPEEARTRGAVVGTGAAAATGGALYGAQKLSRFAPVKNFLGAVGKASGPLMLHDMATQAHRGIFGSGPQYLDVPEKSPVRSQLSGYAAKAAGPLASASALQIPEGIPLPREDGVSPYEAAQPARAAAGDQKFDEALQAFMGLIQEHNASVGGGSPPNFQQAPAMIGAR